MARNKSRIFSPSFGHQENHGEKEQGGRALLLRGRQDYHLVQFRQKRGLMSGDFSSKRKWRAGNSNSITRANISRGRGGERKERRRKRFPFRVGVQVSPPSRVGLGEERRGLNRVSISHTIIGVGGWGKGKKCSLDAPTDL